MTYFIILALLLVAELVYFKIADNCNIIDKPNERSSHSTIVLRGGGIIFLRDFIFSHISSEISHPYDISSDSVFIWLCSF